MSTHYFRLPTRSLAEPLPCASLAALLQAAESRREVEDWRTDAFEAIAPGVPMPPVAPTALRARVGEVAGRWACLATPAHYLAEMTNVRFAADGIIRLDETGASALAADFNRIWSDAGVRMLTVPGAPAAAAADLFCLFDEPLEVSLRDPDEVAERHIDEHLPAGPDASRLTRLMSEMEMWLFGHAVNRARGDRGLATVSGLWLWGGGRMLSALPAVSGWSAGEDVFFDCFAKPAAPGGAVVVMPDAPGTPQWNAAATRWLEPAVAGLRAGRLCRIELSYGRHVFSITKRSLSRSRWRFWRSQKPWQEFLT